MGGKDKLASLVVSAVRFRGSTAIAFLVRRLSTRIDAEDMVELDVGGSFNEIFCCCSKEKTA
jgi:hypothetical protein